MIYRMKTTVLALTAAFLIPSTPVISAGVQDVLDTPAIKSPLAQKKLLNAIVLAGNRLVSVGQRGNIIYSDDRGKTWVQASVPVSCDLVAVKFASARKGWAVGHDGIVLHSSDAGVTWVKQFDGRAAAKTMLSYYTQHPPAADAERIMGDLNRYVKEGADKPFLDLYFEDENNGFIVGAFNLIFHTSDGGKSWIPWYDRTENPLSLHFYGINRIAQDIYLVGEQGLAMKLDRTSGKFRALATPYQGTFFGITGKDGALIFYGMRGHAFRSSDRGVTWQQIDTGTQAALTGAAVSEGGKIVLVSLAGNVLVSADGGRNFNMVKLGNLPPLTAVAALDKDTLALAGLVGVRTEVLK
jgi:photosystem II stability/assembly factor-like uncharacterized protein